MVIMHIIVGQSLAKLGATQICHPTSSVETPIVKKDASMVEHTGISINSVCEGDALSSRPFEDNISNAKSGDCSPIWSNDSIMGMKAENRSTPSPITITENRKLTTPEFFDGIFPIKGMSVGAEVNMEKPSVKNNDNDAKILSALQDICSKLDMLSDVMCKINVLLERSLPAITSSMVGASTDITNTNSSDPMHSMAITCLSSKGSITSVADSASPSIRGSPVNPSNTENKVSYAAGINVRKLRNLRK